MQHTERSASSELCYLEASKVDSPAGPLSELNVLSPSGDPVGSVAGVVVDAAARRVKYLDVCTSGWLRRRHYLLEADELALVDADRKALRLREDLAERDDEAPEDLDPSSLRRFSDDDLMAAMFARVA